MHVFIYINTEPGMEMDVCKEIRGRLNLRADVTAGPYDIMMFAEIEDTEKIRLELEAINGVRRVEISPSMDI